MINRKEITSVAKRMLRQHRGLEDPQIIHPKREWLIGVTISTTIFVLIVWWSVAAHIKHSNTNVDGSAEAASTDTIYREAQVRAALELFEDRNERYNKLIGSAASEPEVAEEVVVEEISLSTTTEAVLEEIATSTIDSTPENIF